MHKELKKFEILSVGVLESSGEPYSPFYNLVLLRKP
jgi:hypothetical protein